VSSQAGSEGGALHGLKRILALQNASGIERKNDFFPVDSVFSNFGLHTFSFGLYA